jgi:NAD+ kinase
MKKIAVITNEKKDQVYRLTKNVIDFLLDLKCGCYANKKIISAHPQGVTELNEETMSECDFAIVIGGDGTILKAIAELSKSDMPLIGINLGRRGFLSDLTPANYQEQLTKIFHDEYEVDERMMVQLSGKNKNYGNALNEVMFRQIQGNGVGDFKVYVDGVLLAHYSSDGVLIAAPTGSTAYSLSAGGPIINPECDVIIIQPIAPHSLNNRSIVINPTEKVVVEFNPEDSSVYLDGILVETKEKKLSVYKSRKNVKFIRIKGYNFYNILFEKLKQVNQFRGGLS